MSTAGGSTSSEFFAADGEGYVDTFQTWVGDAFLRAINLGQEPSAERRHLVTSNLRICHKGGEGNLIPMGWENLDVKEGERDRGVGMIYICFLLYSFVGIAIGSDVFMNAIEVITSATRPMRTATGEVVHVAK
jgi:hypothetical protein